MMAVPALLLGVLAVTGVVETWHGLRARVRVRHRHRLRRPGAAVVRQRDGRRRRLLTNAVGLNSASFNAARIVGPAIAGVHDRRARRRGRGHRLGDRDQRPLATARWCSSSSGCAPTCSTPPSRSARQKGMIRDGMRYIRSRPDLMLVLAIVFFAGTFGLNFQMTSALMATEVFEQGRLGVRHPRLHDGGRLALRRAARRPARPSSAPAGDPGRGRVRPGRDRGGADADVPRLRDLDCRRSGSPR